jgi:hypothetical protein
VQVLWRHIFQRVTENATRKGVPVALSRTTLDDSQLPRAGRLSPCRYGTRFVGPVAPRHPSTVGLTRIEQICLTRLVRFPFSGPRQLEVQTTDELGGMVAPPWSDRKGGVIQTCLIPRSEVVALQLAPGRVVPA